MTPATSKTKPKKQPLAMLLGLLTLPVALSAQAVAPEPAKPATPATPAAAAPATPTPAANPATTPAEPAAEEETIVLSVFTVQAEEETGYVTDKGLSGGRLVTDLSEISAPVAVLTKEFMEDIGATDLNALTDYSLNTQVDLDDGNNADIFSAQTEGLGRDNVNVRIRGLAGSKTMDFLDFDWNFDNYNVNRIDFSLGANAILFGNGGPGGNINLTRDRALLNRSFRKVAFRVDDEGSFRTNFDTNIVLKKRKLALRIEGLHSETTGWRKFDFTDREGLYANLNFQPVRNTNINLLFETGKLKAQADRLIGPQDNISAWLAAGSPVGPIGNITATNPVLPAGLTIAPSGNFTTANGGLLETNNFVFGGPYTVPTERSNRRTSGTSGQYLGPVLYRTQGLPGILIPYHPLGAGFGSGNTFDNRDVELQNEGVVDYTNTAMAGPDSYRTQDFSDFRISIEQRITNDLNVNAFYGRNSTDRFAQTMNRVGGSFALYGEPNSQFIDHVGQMYIESRWQRDFERNNREAAGFNLAWQVKFLGTEHKFSAYIQKDSYRRFFRSGQPFRLAAIGRDPLTGALRLNAQGQPTNQALFMRDYFQVGDPSAHATLRVPTGYFTDANGQSWEAAWVPDNFAELDATSAPFTGNLNRRTYHTLFGQSYFFKRDLILTYGYRKDRTQLIRDSYTFDFNTLQAAGTPAFTDTFAVREPESISVGAVYRLPYRFRLSAGYSENTGNDQEVFALPDASEPPPVKSSSKDLALSWETPSEKLKLRAGYFETKRTGGYQIANDAYWDDITGDGLQLQRLVTPMIAQVGTSTVGEYPIARPLGPIITSLSTLQAGQTSPLITADRAAILNKAFVSPVPTSGNTDRIQSTINANSAPDGSKGYEFRVVGNVGGLNAKLEYSWTKRQKDGHAAQEIAQLDELLALVRQLPDGTPLPTGLTNVTGGEYANVIALNPFSPVVAPGTVPAKLMYEQTLLAAISQLESIAEQRETEFGNRRHFVNLALRYNFKDGALKGLGLRARGFWRSKAYAQNIRTPSTDGSVITQEAVYAPAIYDGSVGISYKQKFNKNSWFNMIIYDLDVDNVFFSELKSVPLRYVRATDVIPGVGEYEVLVKDANGQPIANRFIYQAPRTYRFRVTLDF